MGNLGTRDVLLVYLFFLNNLFIKIIYGEEKHSASSVISKKLQNADGTFEDKTIGDPKDFAEYLKKLSTLKLSQKVQNSRQPEPPYVVRMLRTQENGVNTYYMPSGDGGVIASNSPTSFTMGTSATSNVTSKFSSPLNKEVIAPGFPVPSDTLARATEENRLTVKEENKAPVQNLILNAKATALEDMVPLVPSPPTTSTQGKLLPPEIRQSLNFTELENEEADAQERTQAVQADQANVDSNTNRNTASAGNSSSSGAQAADVRTQEEATQHYVNQARDLIHLPENSTQSLNGNPIIANASTPELKNFLSNNFSSILKSDARSDSSGEKANYLTNVMRNPDFQFEAPKLLGSLNKAALFNQATQASNLSSRKGVTLDKLLNVKKNYELATGLPGPDLKNSKASLANEGSKGSKTKDTVASAPFSLLGALDGAPVASPKSPNKGSASASSKDNINKVDDVEWLRVALWLGADPNLRKRCNATKSSDIEQAYKELIPLSKAFEAQGVLKLVNQYQDFMDDHNLWGQLFQESIGLASSLAKSSYEQLSSEVEADERIMALRLRSRLESYHLESNYSQNSSRSLASRTGLGLAQRHIKELERLFEDKNLTQYWRMKMPIEFKKMQQAYGALVFYAKFSPTAHESDASSLRLYALAVCAIDYISAESRRIKQ